MLHRIKSLLKEAKGSISQTEQVQDEQVAVCAILLEAAEADQVFKPEERREIVIQLGAYFGLNMEQVEELIELTQQELSKSTDLFPFTTAISRNFSPEKKQEVLVMVWQVIFADNILDPYEDQLARRLQSMLSVNHSLLMTAKAQARRNLQARADRNV